MNTTTKRRTKTKPAKANDLNAVLCEIATRVLDVPTLAARNSDSLDFHTLDVASIKAALEAAYAAGREAAAGTPQRDVFTISVPITTSDDRRAGRPYIASVVLGKYEERRYGAVVDSIEANSGRLTICARAGDLLVYGCRPRVWGHQFPETWAVVQADGSLVTYASKARAAAAAGQA